jgi:hypothetical protein
VSWTKRLPEPVRLRDGRELKTLSDARALILGLAESRQHRPTWAYAVELLLQAAETGKRTDIADAWAQISRAVHTEGLRERRHEHHRGTAKRDARGGQAANA